MGKKLLEVKDLHTSFFTANGEVKSVNGVSYYIDEHEIVAVVGESGCGKVCDPDVRYAAGAKPSG